MSRLTVTYGRYVYPESYHRIHLEVTEEFDDFTTRDEAAKMVADFVDAFLSEQLVRHGSGEATTRPANPVTFEDLSWFSWNTKEACELGENGWTGTDDPRADRLHELVVEGGEKGVEVLMDGKKFRVKLSNDFNFLQRRKVKGAEKG